MEIDQLFRPRLAEECIDIPDVGVIRVRALSRLEMLSFSKLESKGVALMERAMLSAAMVDPPMSEAQTEVWQSVSPAQEIMPVIETINRLSGISGAAGKSDLRTDGGRPLD